MSSRRNIDLPKLKSFSLQVANGFVQWVLEGDSVFMFPNRTITIEHQPEEVSSSDVNIVRLQIRSVTQLGSARMQLELRVRFVSGATQCTFSADTSECLGIPDAWSGVASEDNRGRFKIDHVVAHPETEVGNDI